MSPTLAICILWRAFDSRLTSSLSVPFWCEPHGRLSTHSAPHNNGFYFRWTTTTLLIAEHVCRRLDHNAGDTVLSEWEWRAYVVGRSNLRYVTQIKFFIFRFILQTHLFGGYLNLFQFVFFFLFCSTRKILNYGAAFAFWENAIEMSWHGIKSNFIIKIQLMTRSLMHWTRRMRT